MRNESMINRKNIRESAGKDNRQGTGVRSAFWQDLRKGRGAGVFRKRHFIFKEA